MYCLLITSVKFPFTNIKTVNRLLCNNWVTDRNFDRDAKVPTLEEFVRTLLEADYATIKARITNRQRCVAILTRFSFNKTI